MAGVAGFEPAHADTKNRCLTAWLHPSSRLYVNESGYYRTYRNRAIPSVAFFRDFSKTLRLNLAYASNFTAQPCGSGPVHL